MDKQFSTKRTQHVSASTVSCFADVTRILLGTKDEEVTQLLQNDLHKPNKYVETNMKFNSNKFKFLRYGKEQERKSEKTYKSQSTTYIK